MSNEKDKKDRRIKKKENNEKKNKGKKKISIFRLILVIILLAGFITAGVVSGFVYATVKNIPAFNPVSDTKDMIQHSEIFGADGTRIEKILTPEFRTIVKLDQISDHVEDAFIAVEDERFEDHFGIDIKSVFRAIAKNIEQRRYAQGFSTLTQQLARNIYLPKTKGEKSLTRKFKEMYYAIEMEKVLTKDQILEAYLNTIPLGNNAYGVQAAAEVYFSKDASELTIAESALIAGITKRPETYKIFMRERPENVDEDKHTVVGELEVLGETWKAIFNEDSLNRQKTILEKMYEQDKITESEYNDALNEDVISAIKPGQIKDETITTSYFNDFVKDKVIEDLMEQKDYTKEEATALLYKGGLRIYSTVNVNMQRDVEDVYDNLGNLIRPKESRGAKYTDRRLDKYGNILWPDSWTKIAFYKDSNIVNENGDLIIEKGTFELSSNGNLNIKNPKINYRNLDIANQYSLDDNKNLITYSRRYLNSVKVDESYYIIDNDNKQLIITKAFLDQNEDFYSINDKGNLIINSKYYYKTDGILQPQSSVVVIDYRTGQIVAMVGGRGIEGENIFNRALAPRQPGSSMKPLATYLPALDNMYTAGTSIDDVPRYDKGDLWPRNWYGQEGNSKEDDYRGLMTLRYAVKKSVNVAAVKVLEDIGINTSMEYLTKLGIINKEHPEKDTFISRDESKSYNDENLSALGLGGMTKGATPLDMASAYGAIANGGVRVKPICYTKVLDRNGKVILDNEKTEEVKVVNSNVAYLMTDILRSVVGTGGTGTNAALRNMPVAGKTGTTQNMNDNWFVGYTPYYVSAVWMGNDHLSVKLDDHYSASIWSAVNNEVHKGLDYKNFKSPGGFVRRDICSVSGKLATELCEKGHDGKSTVISELFISGTQPKDECDLHVEVEIDKSNGKLATEHCPKNLVEKVVRIQRETPYIPEDNDDYIPTDYKYYVPAEECEDHGSILDGIFDDIVDLFKKVRVSEKKVNLKVDETFKLESIIKLDKKDIEIYWSSKNDEVATIDENGLITALSEGTSIITLTVRKDDKTYVDHCKVTVIKDILVSGVELNSGDTLNLKVNDTFELKAIVSPDDATNKTIKWSLSNDDNAITFNNGNIKAIAPGTATITVTTEDGNHTATCTITVTAVNEGDGNEGSEGDGN